MSLKNLLYRTFFKDAKKGEKITPKDAFAQTKNGKAVLVDVREAAELEKTGIAESAQWIATSEIAAQSGAFKAFVARLPKDKKIIVYCAAGVRAGRFTEWLEAKGFAAANLGGFNEWAKAQLPIQKWNGPQ